MKSTTEVSILQRKAGPQHYSVERIFDAVIRNLPEDIKVNLNICPNESNSMKARWLNARWAGTVQSSVNHITGDVHYLTFNLSKDRTILTILDCVLLERLTGLRRIVGKFLYFTGPVAKCRLVTTISESSKQEIMRHTGCPESKIRVIHVPLVMEHAPDPKPFDVECPNILMIGSAWNKNLENQLKALDGIICKVKLIGKPSDEIINLAHSLKINFEYVSSITDEEVIQNYHRCDLVLFASIYEGFGMPIVEGNLIGRPVITSNKSSMPEMAANAACLVDPHSIDSIRQGILKVLSEEDYRESLIEAGYKNAKRFGVARIADQYAELYREVAGNPSITKPEEAASPTLV